MVQLIAVLVTGLGIGWLAGLSVSPVIATVLASLVGIGGGVVAGLRGAAGGAGAATSAGGAASVDARPAAVLVLGIALGAPLGILARTHQLFEPAAAPARRDQTAQGVLFRVPTEQCAELRARARDGTEQPFRSVLAGIGTWGRLLEEHIADTEDLRDVVEDLCAQD